MTNAEFLHILLKHANAVEQTALVAPEKATMDAWETTKHHVTNSISSYFPVVGRFNTLKLNKIEIDDKLDPVAHLKSQADAKNNGRTWGVPVYGEMSLVDKDGKEINKSRIKLCTLPKQTSRYSYIVDGGEWQVEKQWQLKSGIYSRIQENGHKQTEFNLAKPFARESHIYIPFDPKKKKYTLRYGTANYPLYSILKTLGVSDDQMKQTWGEDVYKANLPKDYQKDIIKFYNKNLKTRGVIAEPEGDKGVTYNSIEKVIQKAFNETALLEETTKITMGKPYNKVNGEALLHASKNTLEVENGSREPDNIHSLAFKKLRDVEDYIQDKYKMPKLVRSLQSKIRNNLDRKSKVVEIISSDLFNKPLKQVFTGSSLSQRAEQVNPLEMLSNRSITTITGEGGLKNERAIRPEMKIIDPTHFGFLDPVHTPESEKTGISLHLPLAVKKIGNEAKTLVFNIEKDKMEYVNPTELHSNKVVLPDQIKWGSNRKPIIPDHHVKILDPTTHEFIESSAKNAKYVLPSAKGLFDDATNLIPFLQNNQGNRTMTGSRQATQAISLSDREAPLVQVQAENPALTWEKKIGNLFSHVYHGPEGVVKEIKRDELGHPETVVIKPHDGPERHIEVYNHFPLNDSKTHINATLKVKEGDAIKKGDLIADTNYTQNGALALGSNLHMGYFPYKGLTFEDGLVISETGAKKLTSEHLHKVTLELDPRKDVVNKSKFLTYAQTTSKKLTKEQTEKLDTSGLIKPGTKVKPNDILVAAIGKNEPTGQLAMVGTRLKGAINPYKDKSLKWDSDYEGEVIKTIKHPNEREVTVFIKTKEPLQVGDKVCGRHGNKGVVGAIIPDHEMPRIGGPDGKPLDMIMNPSGIASRINIGQMLETAASKIALKTGKPYIVNNFGGKDIDYTEKLIKDLATHNLSDTDKIWDPVAKRHLTKEALTGHQYIMKLKHTSEKKLSVRGLDNRLYGINQEPKGGGDHGAQSLGQLELYALLASGARHNLKEIATYKAEKPINAIMAEEDFWDRVQMGQPLPPPKPTFAYKKFEHLMMGLGLNIKKDGHVHSLVPMTDKGVLKLSHGEISDAGMMRGKNEKELAQGLFDPKITGGIPTEAGKGLNWAHFKLPEPFPNPVFIGQRKMPGPAVLLTGLKFEDFEEVAKGKQTLNGKTGGAAIRDALSKIDVKAELKKTQEQLPKLKGAALNKMNRKARYLMALDKTGLKADEAYMMNHVPIIPPVYRPLIPMEDGRIIFSDVNYLYKQAIMTANQLKEIPKEMPEEEKTNLRAGLYDKLKAIAGLGAVPLYEGNRKLKGIIQTIAGDNPKSGFFQSKIMRRRQELSMRGAITPEPAMQIDQVGLPRTSAMELYKPFVVRELMRMGRDIIDARKEVKEGTDLAKKALDRAVADRPVLLKRDPVLHKYNIQAFKPLLVDGNSVKLHPLVCGSFNADFDGDTMAAYLPITEEAKREAIEKLMPSKNLFSATHYGVMHAPDQEAVLGIHLLTNWGPKTNKQFKNHQDIINDESLHINDVVSLNGKETTKGRMLLAEKLPEKFKTYELMHSPQFTLKKGSLHNLLEDMAKHDPKGYPFVVDHLKNLGNKYSYDEGFSFRLKDLKPMKELRGQILKPFDDEANKVIKSSLPQNEKDAKLIDIYSKATTELDKILHPEYRKIDNHIFKMVDTKARGSAASFRQMVMGPMLMKDALNRTLPTPIKRSYSEGLDIGDYWTTLHGARKGTLQRVEGTSEPGMLTKEIVNLNISTLITKPDCGTTTGTKIDLHRPDGKEEDDLHDRFTTKPIQVHNRVIPANTLITPEIHNDIKSAGHKHIEVRSPLSCKDPHGICAKCFGLNENGKLHEVGTNIGVLASQSMGEPATQLAMDSFHCLHPDSVVFCRNPRLNLQYVTTLRRLFDSIPNEGVFESGEEIKVPTKDIEIWNGTWTKLTHVRRHKPDSSMVFVSNSVMGTICQDTHPIAVVENDIEFVEAKDIVGRLIKSDLSIANPKDRYSVYHPCGHSLPESGYFVGAYLSEGSIRYKGTSKVKKPYAVVISQNDEPIKDRILENLCQYRPDSHVTVGKKDLVTNSLALGYDFERLFGRYSYEKHLPESFLQESNSWLGDVLSGIIDGDGTIKRYRNAPDQVSIDTTSFYLAQQISIVCSVLGIRSNLVQTTKKKIAKHQGFRVTLTLLKENKKYLSKSIKVGKITKWSTKKIDKTIHVGKAKVTPTFYTEEYVYDATTESGTLYASGIFQHNTGGVAASRGGGSVDKFTRLDQLLNIPKTLPGAATLASAHGKISKITKDTATNAHHVWIGDEKHFVPRERNVTVNIGDTVEKGQVLSDGNIHPKELLKYKGINAVRDYLTHALKNEIYKDDTDIRRRNIETVVRNLTNHTKVTDPGDSHHMIGDLVHITQVEDFNSKISPKQKPIRHAPIIEGISQAAVHKDEDYLSRFNFRYIKENLLQAASQSWSTHLKGNNPVAPFAAGTIGADKLPGY